MTDSGISTNIAGATERTAGVLRARPSALLFDFDGTLSRLVDDPASASIEARSEAALHRLSGLVDVVGIVTGRAADDVQTRLDTTELVVVGNHGLEWVIRGKHSTHEAGVAAEAAVNAAVAEIRERIEHDRLSQGVIFENKRLSASVHYRMAPNQKQVGSVLVPLARRVAKAHGLRLTEGKLIVELRPMAEVSKGTAIRQLQREFGLASIAFLGDDLTDVDGFLELRKLREEAVCDTLAVGVIGTDSHPRVAETADIAITEVTGVSEYLEHLVTALADDRGGA
jgi:trehalose 6-phosphate phosphatase